LEITELSAKEIKERMIRRLPILKFVDLDVLEVSEGRVLVRVRHSPLLEREGGFLFGGVIAMLFDGVLGLTVLTVNDVGDQATVNLSINFLRRAMAQEYIVEGRVIKKGRRLVFVEAELRSPEGTLFSKAHGVWALVEKFPS